ncbi:MAG: beta-propeller fold lactonase family protein [Spirochaetales bacterium]|nr:beta-propeller fold lactonase family protein [Leptospiraceae bacterium]MCP5481178.1 beta-propeller fold lactonase family protein [Spirochaetales bacterium]
MSSLLLIPFRTRYFIYFGQGTVTEARTLDTRSGALGTVSDSPFSNTLTGYPDPTGRFMYSLEYLPPPNNVRSYTINAYTGTLAPTSSPLASANNNPTYVDFHPNAQFVYVVNYSSLDVSAFVIDQNTGNLSKIGDFATSCACGNLSQLRVTPNGKFLYVAGNGGPETITGFSIDQNTGALALIGNTSVGITGMDAVLVDPTSSYVYAVSSGGTLPGYRIDPNSGALTALSGSPFAGVANNFRGAMHPSGKFLYTVNILGAQLAWHSIAADGSLSASTTLGFGTNLQYVTIDPTGAFGFINDGTAPSIFQFSIDQATGAASLVSGTPLTLGAVVGSVQVARTRAWP